MAEDWEEKMLERMAEMLRNMGMTVEIDQLRALMNQFRSQFDSMGIDPERIAKGDVNFNFDMSDLMKLFQSGVPIEDMISNLGVDLKVGAVPAAGGGALARDARRGERGLPRGGLILNVILCSSRR